MPSSLRSKVHSGPVKRSCVSVAAIGWSHSGKASVMAAGQLTSEARRRILPEAMWPSAGDGGGGRGRAAAVRLLPALLGLAGFGALCPRSARPTAPPPAHEAAVELAPLSAQLSEPGGYFDTDNLISNETSS